MLWHCWLGDRKGIRPVKSWVLSLLVVMSWLELCASCSSSCHHWKMGIMPSPLIGGGIKRCFCLTSVAYIGPNSRTERPRKSKIGTEVAHVTSHVTFPTPLSRSKVKVTRPLCSPPCWRVRRLQRWSWEHVGRGKLLRYHLLGGGRRFGANG